MVYTAASDTIACTANQSGVSGGDLDNLWNREHVVPKAFLPSKWAKADLHNLRASIVSNNEARDHAWYGEYRFAKRYNSRAPRCAEDCAWFPKTKPKWFLPPQHARGNVAR